MSSDAYLRGLRIRLCYLWHKFTICILSRVKREHIPINIWRFSLRDSSDKRNFLLVHKFLSFLLNEFLQSEILESRNHIQSKMSIALLKLLMNNQVQFECLWCRVAPDFVVQINNFFSLVLFSAVIDKRRGQKLISKTVINILDSSSRVHFASFYPEDIQIFFLKNYRFCRKSGNDANSREREGHALYVILM